MCAYKHRRSLKTMYPKSGIMKKLQKSSKFELEKTVQCGITPGYVVSKCEYGTESDACEDGISAVSRLMLSLPLVAHTCL